jgi:predicted Zn-dependent peptidase
MTETRFRQWTERRRAGETLAGRLTPAPRIALPASGDMGYALDAALLPRGIAEHDARTATEILSGRVAFRIRESLGMAYTIGASLERVGDRLIYVAAASTRRENAPILMSELEAVRRQTTSGRDDGEVTRAGRALYGSLLRRQESRLNQAMQAVWAARDDRDPLDWWRRADEYRDVDPAAVNSALDAIATADTTVVIVVR